MVSYFNIALIIHVFIIGIVIGYKNYEINIKLIRNVFIYFVLFYLIVGAVIIRFLPEIIAPN